jgi:ABC-type multidrug transport system ATPase subunit
MKKLFKSKMDRLRKEKSEKQRLREIMLRKERIRKEMYPVSIENLKFSYGDNEVLRDISLNFKKGNITAVIGKSGSGKSTLLRIISSILTRKYSGKIKIFGGHKFFGKSRVGFVPQEASVISDLSILDNIKIYGLNLGVPPKEAIKVAENLMKLLNLNEDLKKKPSELSGGQKARLNIILSLLGSPEVIIFDEPFSGLDFANRKLLWHFIHYLKGEGKSIILTSHLLTETQDNVDVIAILKNGEFFFNGDIYALKSKLKINFIMEVRFFKFTSEKIEKIRKYCVYNDIKVIDSYDKYMMFALSSERTKDRIVNLFRRLKIDFDVIEFREPNLDEIFLMA